MNTHLNINSQDIAPNERLIIENREGRLEISKESLTFGANTPPQTEAPLGWSFSSFIFVAIIIYMILEFIYAQMP